MRQFVDEIKVWMEISLSKAIPASSNRRKLGELVQAAVELRVSKLIDLKFV